MSKIEMDSRKIRRTSSGSVILRKIDGQWNALLLRAWSHWDFPKGNVEPGETLMKAALREVQEETGISQLAFPWGEAFARTSVYSRDKVAYYSISTTAAAEVVLAPNPVTGLREHDEYRWVPWSEVPQMLSPRLSCITDWVSSVTRIDLVPPTHIPEHAAPGGHGTPRAASTPSPLAAQVELPAPVELSTAPLAPPTHSTARPSMRKSFFKRASR